jgi:hypothetical protein
MKKSILFLMILTGPFVYGQKLTNKVADSVCICFAGKMGSLHYYLPPKKDWGIPPDNNPYWDDFQDVTEPIKNALAAKRSVLCWQKEAAAYRQFFIVWW